jgi:farnesyl diphosphate synthase
LSAVPDTLRDYRARVERALDARLPAPTTVPSRLHEAMRYATLGGGKRVRACLVYAAGRALGAADETLDTPACAVELIHAYSLAHDDLPCMDDDDLRRGRPTVHRAWDEATALLVGDALQTLALELLATDPTLRVDAVTRLEMIALLARASGSTGMVGGQAIDLASVGKPLGFAELEDMHRRKTGALIEASVRLGALAAGTRDPAPQQALADYARALGLAFQIVDDILDVEGETASLGKSAGKDQARNKPTYPSALGLDGARQKARELHEAAIEGLRRLGGDTAMLASLAEYIVRRRQ